MEYLNSKLYDEVEHILTVSPVLVRRSCLTLLQLLVIKEKNYIGPGKILLFDYGAISLSVVQ